MIVLKDVCKSYHTREGRKTVLNRVNFSMQPGERVGILGRNGAGKSTLIRLISGAELPDSGQITRSMSVSWPLAFGGAFQNSLTGLDNLRFICRVYGVPFEGTVDYVDDFSELGAYLKEPVRTYSAGMRARLAFAISMVVEFDCFLIDEVYAVGDDRFQRKCNYELFERRADRAMIFVSHNQDFIKDHCHRSSVLHNCTAVSFDDIDTAYKYYEENI